MSRVSWSASLYVGQWYTGAPCINGWTDRDAAWGGETCVVSGNHVLDGCDFGATYAANTKERSVNSGDATSCEITLTTCFYDFIVVSLCLVLTKRRPVCTEVKVTILPTM